MKHAFLRWPCALIFCSSALTATLTAQEFDVVLSQGTVTRFTPANDQPDPMQQVTRKNLERMAMTGLAGLALAPGVGAGYVASARAVANAVKIENLGLEILDARSDKLQSVRANFLDPRVARLQELHEAGITLQDNREAQRILDEIRGEAEKPGGAWSFAGRALFSKEALYIVVRHRALDMVSKFLGKTIASRLEIGLRTKLVWQNDTGRKLLHQLIVRRWDTLETRGQLAKQWTDALTKEAAKLAIAIVYNKALREQYDAVYTRIMGEHPTTVRAVGSVDLRLAMAIQPAMAMPMMAQPAPIRAIAVPAAVRVYADAVVSATKTENQFIQSQNYTVTPREPHTQSRGNDRSPPQEPRESHPAPRMPNIGSSFGGGRGETLWSR